MPYEPFRFLHAANLYLDHQLRGVGPVPEELRETVEQATLSAWERIVDAAITRQVDFVLLAGNSFDAADQTLTGQVALVEGLEQLGEHDIPVFIVPGVADPDTAWRLAMALPENVTRFGGELSEPVSLSRNGRRFCTIHHVMANTRDLNATDGNGLDELAEFAPQLEEDSSGPFDIALLETITNDAALPPELTDGPTHPAGRSGTPLTRPLYESSTVARCPIEYWALGDGMRRQSWRVGRGMAHNPGGPQGLSPQDTGIAGCTLVEVDGEGRVHESFLPMARVRWENVVVGLTQYSTREAAVHDLRVALESIPRTAHSELWLVTWHLTGTGQLYDELLNQDGARQIWQEAVQGVMSGATQYHLRRIRSGNTLDQLAGYDFLTQEYARQLSEFSAAGQVIPRAIEGSALAGSAWAERMQKALGEVDTHAALQEAHRLGWTWLKTSM